MTKPQGSVYRVKDGVKYYYGLDFNFVVKRIEKARRFAHRFNPGADDPFAWYVNQYFEIWELAPGEDWREWFYEEMIYVLRNREPMPPGHFDRKVI